MINICFRVDAGNKIGLGHLMESIVLAKSLKKRAHCNIFFLTKDYPPAVDILRGRGFQVERVKEDISEEEEIKMMLFSLNSQLRKWIPLNVLCLFYY